MRVWIGMTGGMAKYWIIPRMGDKELPRVGHQLATTHSESHSVFTAHSCSQPFMILDDFTLGNIYPILTEP